MFIALKLVFIGFIEPLCNELTMIHMTLAASHS